MRIIKKIFFGLFLLISLTYLFTVVSPIIFKDFYPYGIRTAIVLTGSMEPTLAINDFIIVKKPNNIELNDIVSYKSDNSKKEILHRVVSINGDEIITKGDANNKEDVPININQISGVYIGKVKYLGKIISFFTKPIGFSIAITIFMIIMLFPIDKKIKK
jgi:signal peptidase